jgi:hypothetical protein
VSSAKQCAEEGGLAIHYGKRPHPSQVFIPTNKNQRNNGGGEFFLITQGFQ